MLSSFIFLPVSTIDGLRMEVFKVHISSEVISQQVGVFFFALCFSMFFLHTLKSTVPMPVFTLVIL